MVERITDDMVERLPLTFKDTPDYAEVYDAKGELVALTTRPEFFASLATAALQHQASLPVEAEGWQTIETCPRNVPVNLARKRAGRWEVVAGFYDEGTDVLDYPWSFLDLDCVGNLNAFHEDDGPTLWQPLAAAPSTGGK
jgi:hypothetical protein